MIEKRDIGDVKLPELGFLSQQTRGTEGYLQMYLYLCWEARHTHKKDDFDCDVIIYKNRIGNMNCWCILQDLMYRFEDYLDLGIWTPKAKRGNGYGSELLKFVEDEYSDRKIAVWPHPKDPSVQLYKKFDHHPFYAFDIDSYKDGRYEKFDFSKFNQ